MATSNVAAAQFYRIAIYASILMLSMAMLATSLRAQKPAENRVRELVHEQFKTYHGGGIVVGVIDSSGSYVIAEGLVRDGDTASLDGTTIFEIASITKVFTSLVLADMATKGEVKLTDKVTKYLPRSATRPAAGIGRISLADLATHHSGLPRLPADFSPADPNNPYADYSVADLNRFISHYKPARPAGAEYEYSNLGAGLLGYVLAQKERMSYEALVRSRITGPLGMANTMIAIPPELESRFAQGHNEAGTAVAHWDIPVISGLGALRSNVNDMLIFLRAEMGLAGSDLSTAMKLTQQPRADAAAGMKIGLAWHLLPNVDNIVWHNGGTAGFHSFIGFDPVKHVGVVVLSNNASDCDLLAINILRGK